MHYGNQYQWAVFKIITHLIKFSVSIFGCWLFSLVADKIKGLHGVWLCTRNTSISMDCIGTHQRCITNTQKHKYTKTCITNIQLYKYTNTCKYTNTKLAAIPISKALLHRNTGPKSKLLLENLMHYKTTTFGWSSTFEMHNFEQYYIVYASCLCCWSSRTRIHQYQ